jgi:hypothetical protein
MFLFDSLGKGSEEQMRFGHKRSGIVFNAGRRHPSFALRTDAGCQKAHFLAKAVGDVPDGRIGVCEQFGIKPMIFVC